MNIEQTFLIKYGLHGYVGFDGTADQGAFRIDGAGGSKMIAHAKYLISEHWGASAGVIVG